MQFDTGSVHLQLLTDDAGRVREARIQSRRPRASLVFVGKKPEQVLSLVPLLFALCGRAQTLAARLALAAAEGRESSVDHDTEVAAEAAREHLWHLLESLPGEASSLKPQGLKALARPHGLAEFLQPLLACPPSVWLARLSAPGGLHHWLTGDAPLAAPLRPDKKAPPWPGETPAMARLLPNLSAACSRELWPALSDEMVACPTYRGKAAETGALARQMSPSPPAATEGVTQHPFTDDLKTLPPLSQRRLARLFELAHLSLPRDANGSRPHPLVLPGMASSVQLSPGRGRALVETARGLLVHEVTVEREQVTRYRLMAPTEWNFHPQGPLSSWLIGLNTRDENAPDAFQEEIKARVTALDPCVGWQLEIIGPHGQTV